jgi:hypothetical protein
MLISHDLIFVYIQNYPKVFIYKDMETFLDNWMIILKQNKLFYSLTR